MKNPGHPYPIIATIILLMLTACVMSRTEPETPIPPITIGSDLTAIDVCTAIPVDDMEAVIGRSLIAPPKRFDYYETKDSSGCWYDTGKDSEKTAYFGYVVIGPLKLYDDQPLHLKKDVAGLGDEAYFNNGADARQLWVKLNGKCSFVVAIGDRENEEGALSIAKLLVSAIK